ncbi:hypothetical protein K443DRAFT_255770 [Laccaria amethystina LaAM-08-1]|uniref:Uncharacterized protein n=1 Tax=Laccaria amethystina LaAM-08-1 TaxID=1095629 RepID=A0A0C9X7G0_9AGAR|nr:hypothetical protein K443DRAFT_255770 [Laccaria amethystina LaAM-08-1]
MVQRPKDLMLGSEAEALHQRSVQRWSTLDHWRRLCRALLIRESSHPIPASNMQPVSLSRVANTFAHRPYIPSNGKPLPPSVVTSSSSRCLCEPLIRELSPQTIWI